MTEQQSQTAMQCSHPEAADTRWGDSIGEERTAELETWLRQWDEEADHAGRMSPFWQKSLTGADVYWLAERVRDDAGNVPDLHLEGAILSGAHLEGASLARAHLAGTDLREAHLEGAVLSLVDLTSAELREANMADVLLVGAHLERAFLGWANLAGANLAEAHLEAAYLIWAHLEGANLRSVYFDKSTKLSGVTLGSWEWGFVQLADAHWDGVDLAVVDWPANMVLGDEQVAREWTGPAIIWEQGTGDRVRRRQMSRAAQALQQSELFRAALRANRQLASVLWDQGMNEEANRFAYRAHMLQRKVLLRRLHIPQYLGSWFLDLISGYGYKPMRSFITYIFIICAFAAAYLLNAQFAAPHLTWDEALVLSISSFHGRGFFTSGISLGDTLARLAAGEAIVGLLIEITFIATFTQRFFAR